MNITVVGFGHFAGVVASCVAERGHTVAQLDFEPHLLREGQKRAEDEPGYVPFHSAGDCAPDLVWMAYDVPLDDTGAPVVDEVIARIVRWHQAYPVEVPFLISCQWPVGTLAIVQERCPDRALYYVMENVRAGKAMADFRQQAFIAVGVSEHGFGPPLDALLDPFTAHIMDALGETVEMAKHAMNAFMALQVAFANELGQICRVIDADAGEVATILRADRRVSPIAPLLPGQPFGGGSLGRDVRVLERLIAEHQIDAPILSAILPSNAVVR